MKYEYKRTRLGSQRLISFFGDLFIHKFSTMTLGDRLALFAEERFGSQEKMAAAVALAPQTISKYVKGVSEPGAKTLAKLKTLGLSIDWLLTGEGVMDAKPDPKSHGMWRHDQIKVLRTADQDIETGALRAGLEAGIEAGLEAARQYKEEMKRRQEEEENEHDLSKAE